MPVLYYYFRLLGTPQQDPEITAKALIAGSGVNPFGLLHPYPANLLAPLTTCVGPAAAWRVREA
jgi:hypothetical protein